MDPLYPNPGGVVDPDHFVGRQAELQRLLEALSHGGAHVTGERRTGKTSLLAKVAAQLEREGLAVLRISAETSSIENFQDRLLRELREHRLLRQSLGRWEKEIDGTISLTVGSSGIKLHGKAKKGAARELDLIDLLLSAGKRAGSVLMIDEITVLCQGLGPDAALEFLRNLRAQRQGRRPVPLVLSGSIGLHHALTDTTPINDLWVIAVGQMSDADARELTERLLLGIEMDADGSVVEEILDKTSGIPYYIQAVVDRLRDQPQRAVHDIIAGGIQQNDWHTEHYVTRLDEYFGTDAPLARAVLDELARSFPDALTLEDFGRILSTTIDPLPSRDQLIELLSGLEKDHYLTRERTAARMSSGLLAWIWRTHRWL